MKPGVSGPPTPLSEFHGGPYLSDIRCFKNMHLVLETGRAGQGSSPDAKSNTNEITSQRPALDRAPAVSDNLSVRCIIQYVTRIPNPTGLGKTKGWRFIAKVDAIGRKEASVVTFRAILDADAEVCLMAESLAARFGTEYIDRIDRPVLHVLGERVVRLIGRIDSDFHVSTRLQLSRQSFYVIPDRIVRGRFDAILGREAIGRMDLLHIKPPFGWPRGKSPVMQYRDKIQNQPEDRQESEGGRV